MAKYPVAGPGSEGGTRSVYLNLRPQMPGGFGGLIPYLTEGGNKQTILMFQIETAGALNEVEEICKIPGVDCAFIGPGDLAASWGWSRSTARRRAGARRISRARCAASRRRARTTAW